MRDRSRKTLRSATVVAVAVSSGAWTQGVVRAEPTEVPAAADEPGASNQAVEPPSGRRVFGVGSAIGAGIAGASILSSDANNVTTFGVGAAIMLPSLELSFFTQDQYSVDISIPVTNMVLVSALLGGLVYNTDVFFNFNVGSGLARLVVGPGLGFSFVAADSLTHGLVSIPGQAAIRLPAEVGVELLTDNEVFGFKMLARPWAELGFGGGVTTIGGGVLGLLVFSGYGTTTPPVADATLFDAYGLKGDAPSVAPALAACLPADEIPLLRPQSIETSVPRY